MIDRKCRASTLRRPKSPLFTRSLPSRHRFSLSPFFKKGGKEKGTPSPLCTYNTTIYPPTAPTAAAAVPRSHYSLEKGVSTYERQGWRLESRSPWLERRHDKVKHPQQPGHGSPSLDASQPGQHWAVKLELGFAGPTHLSRARRRTDRQRPPLFSTLG